MVIFLSGLISTLETDSDAFSSRDCSTSMIVSKAIDFWPLDAKHSAIGVIDDAGMKQGVLLE